MHLSGVRPSVCPSMGHSSKVAASLHPVRAIGYGLITLQSTRGIVRFLREDEALSPLSRSRSRSSVRLSLVWCGSFEVLVRDVVICCGWCT